MSVIVKLGIQFSAPVFIIFSLWTQVVQAQTPYSPKPGIGGGTVIVAPPGGGTVVVPPPSGGTVVTVPPAPVIPPPATAASPNNEVDANFALASRRGDGIYVYYDFATHRSFTYIPYTEYFFSDAQIRAAFEQAQDYTRKASIGWASRALAITDKSLTPQELQNLKAWDQRIRSREISPQNVRDEIAKNSRTDTDIFRLMEVWNSDKLELQQSFDRFNHDVDQYESLPNNQFALLLNQIWRSVFQPSAAFGYITLKVPPAWAEELKKSMPKVGNVASWLLNGSVTITFAVRPWHLVVRDMATGEEFTQFDFLGDSTMQLWIGVDRLGKATMYDGHLRRGAGFFFGPISDFRKFSGLFGGRSLDLNFSKKHMRGTNVQYGAIAPMGMNEQNLNGYFSAGYQFGETDEEGFDLSEGRFNAGFVIPLGAIYDYFRTEVGLKGTTAAILQTVISALPLSQPAEQQVSTTPVNPNTPQHPLDNPEHTTPSAPPLTPTPTPKPSLTPTTAPPSTGELG